ncbi:type I-E CRISPR-associated protein Cse2/CasB [Lacticaseibacillus brantae]|uniref:Type I-E CRISPR-associated protein Cse2/CasB n=1 Tax=Lacticaseibacillus brantae DSM 23927 TaxID=1423727 RepID=A0A0R2AYN6_9LACO|nr:type I-E CRISPR-associated protein Cse2/CasB [Lacticaseibacillus brantae]KRM72128.1 hypothetical protein FC34_GL001112 [Lacticaseibacillus brantae DSM 23927]
MANKVNSFEVQQVTERIINDLYNFGAPDKATLASVRGAMSITDVRAQAVWPVMMAEMRPEMLSHTGKPTYAETAIYAALRLFAISQQGQSQFAYARAAKASEPQGYTLFQVLAQMRRNESDRTRLDRRIQPLLAVGNVNRVVNELTHLVEIVKGTRQPIDFAQLAGDLYSFQMSYESANQVRLRWGQQFFAVTKVS